MFPRLRTVLAACLLLAVSGAFRPASAQPSERSGKQVVEQVCAACHAAGKNGAPKIGDRNAWTPRLKEGVDNLVRSAIRGHGGMPPRGDKTDLTDAEIRAAVLYMVNPAAPTAKEGAAAVPARSGAQFKTVGGIEIQLGLVLAESLRRFPEGSTERTMHGGVPAGSGYYHLNVSLLDSGTQSPITDAKVEARVGQLGMSSETKALELVTVQGVASYGNYVRLIPKSQYVIVVRVERPGSPSRVEARFEQRTF